MPIDPAGTTPGLTPGALPQEVVNIKCRNAKCESIQAVIVKIQGQEQQRIYRCAVCQHSWGVNVGGAANF